MKAIINLFVLACIFSACTSDSPSIDSFSVLNSNSEILKEDGAQLQFSYSFSDDNGLSKYRVSVIDDFEGARVASAPWYYEDDFDLSGTSASDTKSIELPYPDIEPGRYKLTLTVQDVDQQESAQNKTFYVIE